MTSPSPSEPRTPPVYHAAFTAAPTAFAATTALYVTGTALVGFIVAVGVASSAGLIDVAAGAIAYGAVALGLVAFAHARGGVARVGLRWPARRFVIAAILIGCAAWYLGLRLVLALRPPGDTSALHRMVGQTALLPTLFAIAIAPAIGEELMFRGVLARGLATRMPAALAVVLSAAVFSLYHLIPIQMVATLPLGLALGLLAVRSDSIVPTMIVHALNNAIAVVIARGEVPVLGQWIGGHPNASLATAVIVVIIGLAVALRGRATAITAEIVASARGPA
jgi:sodium transport system permease protein